MRKIISMIVVLALVLSSLGGIITIFWSSEFNEGQINNTTSGSGNELNK
ncbi:hypothetical protein KAZ01_02075 [Candidatus Gracilibacteria bacterium]|nr:hypothetical protein [Candidatus Gracilibacteria bacterium]